MNQLLHQQLVLAIDKFQKTYYLLQSSVGRTASFDINKSYTADEFEPYDALSDRFIRIVELAIKLFRTYEYYMQAEQSQT